MHRHERLSQDAGRFDDNKGRRRKQGVLGGVGVDTMSCDHDFSRQARRLECYRSPEVLKYLKIVKCKFFCMHEASKV